MSRGQRIELCLVLVRSGCRIMPSPIGGSETSELDVYRPSLSRTHVCVIFNAAFPVNGRCCQRRNQVVETASVAGSFADRCRFRRR